MTYWTCYYCSTLYILSYITDLGKRVILCYLLECKQLESSCLYIIFSDKVEFSSVAQSWPTLCDPKDWSTPGFPVLPQLPELTQTHIHWVGDAIQPSHPLPSPSPATFNHSQYQGLFQWVSSLHHVAKSIGVAASTSVLSMNIHNCFPSGLTVLIPCIPRNSQESSPKP